MVFEQVLERNEVERYREGKRKHVTSRGIRHARQDDFFPEGIIDTSNSYMESLWGSAGMLTPYSGAGSSEHILNGDYVHLTSTGYPYSSTFLQQIQKFVDIPSSLMALFFVHCHDILLIKSSF